MVDLAVQVAQIEERGKSNTHRIDKLEADTEVIGKLATSVELLAQNMDRMASEQEKQGQRLDTLEKEPARQWGNFKKTVFTSLISTLCGGIMGAVLALILK